MGAEWNYWHQHFESDSAGLLETSRAAINVVAAIKFSLHSYLLSPGPMSPCLHTGRFIAICFVQHFKIKTAISLSITTATEEESRQDFFFFWPYIGEKRKFPYDIWKKKEGGQRDEGCWSVREREEESSASLASTDETRCWDVFLPDRASPGSPQVFSISASLNIVSS